MSAPPPPPQQQQQQRSASAAGGVGRDAKSYFEQQREALIGEIAMVRRLCFWFLGLRARRDGSSRRQAKLTRAS